MFEDSRNLTDRGAVILNVLEHVQKDDSIDASRRQGALYHIEPEQRHIRHLHGQPTERIRDAVSADHEARRPVVGKFPEQVPARTTDLEDHGCLSSRLQMPLDRSAGATPGRDVDRMGAAWDGLFVKTCKGSTPARCSGVVVQDSASFGSDLESGAGPDGGLATQVRPGERRRWPSWLRSMGIISHWWLLASSSR